MTPTDFIKKWQAADLKECSASQAHFLDHCGLLDIEDSISSDPRGDWLTFERGASKTPGGEGSGTTGPRASSATTKSSHACSG
ncbi:hypothetical protein [Mameliella alba]|uniref:hypothetical protein n=1 Tax=Mameliella alba TaxID=561184 RepID=UPI00142F6AFA|nr:hypothetical protein [Mameliella alba]